MARTPMTEAQYLEALNRVLAEQDGVTPDMRFVAAPPGSAGSAMQGYDTSTPYDSHPAYPISVKIARQLYELVPTQR